MNLTAEALARLPRCREFTENPRLLRLIRYASSKNRIPFFYIENLRHGVSPAGGEDPQKHLHSDTFHPCVKAGLFLEDVEDRNGPFTYVPGSQRLSWRRVKWEYAESLKAGIAGADADRYWDGSFRIDEATLKALGFAAPKPLKVPANTLVVANTHGFHRRGDAEPGSSRLALWMQARDNPFNPLFTPFPKTTAKLAELFWFEYLKKRDEKMRGQGRLETVEGYFEAGL